PDASFTALQQMARVPVLVDFNCCSVGDAHAFIDRGARALSIKPGRLGLSDCRQIAKLADQAAATAVVGLFGESALGTLSALQLASTLNKQALPAEVTWFLAMTEQVANVDLHIREGKIQLPQTA